MLVLAASRACSALARRRGRVPRVLGESDSSVSRRVPPGASRQAFPPTLAAPYTDLIQHTMRRHGEMVIQLELAVDGHLRQDVLERACDLMLDVEPVLGCRLDVDRPTSLWRRLPDSQRAVLNVVHRAEDYEAARTAGLDATRGAQVAVVPLAGRHRRPAALDDDARGRRRGRAPGARRGPRLALLGARGRLRLPSGWGTSSEPRCRGHRARPAVETRQVPVDLGTRTVLRAARLPEAHARSRDAAGVPGTLGPGRQAARAAAALRPLALRQGAERNGERPLPRGRVPCPRVPGTLGRDVGSPDCDHRRSPALVPPENARTWDLQPLVARGPVPDP